MAGSSGALGLLALLVGAPPASTAATSSKQFLSYGRLPTWGGVAVDWHLATPGLHYYSPVVYDGHAEYVSRALKTGLTFREFKARVRHRQTRRYVPFFVYDLRGFDVKRQGQKRPSRFGSPRPRAHLVRC